MRTRLRYVLALAALAVALVFTAWRIGYGQIPTQTMNDLQNGKGVFSGLNYETGQYQIYMSPITNGTYLLDTARGRIWHRVVDAKTNKEWWYEEYVETISSKGVYDRTIKAEELKK